MYIFFRFPDLINDEVFRKCKRGVRIINCARRRIDKDALFHAMESDKCARVGLDVFLKVRVSNLAEVCCWSKLLWVLNI